MKQPRLSVIPAVFAAAVLVNARAASAQVVDLLPNLTPRPASEISIVQDQTTGHLLLRFAAINTNLGLGPLEVRAGGATGQGQVVYQRIYQSDGSYYDSSAPTTITTAFRNMPWPGGPPMGCRWSRPHPLRLPDVPCSSAPGCAPATPG